MVRNIAPYRLKAVLISVNPCLILLSFDLFSVCSVPSVAQKLRSSALICGSNLVLIREICGPRNRGIFVQYVRVPRGKNIKV